MRRSVIVLFLSLYSHVALGQIGPSPTPPMNGLPGQAAGPLSANGRIPDVQLPASAFEYKGAWDASSNTPALADGVGVAGDVYAISVSGSQNLGGGTVSYSAGNLLMYNGTTYQQIGGGTAAAPANPTGQIGLSVVDGTLPTFMRSDAAPALNQAIVPTWTGIHTFNGGLTSATPSVVLGNAAPELRFNRSTSPLDQKIWRAYTNDGCLNVYAGSDVSPTTGQVAYATCRAGTTVNLHSWFLNSATVFSLAPNSITSNSGSGPWTHTGSFVSSGFNSISLTPSASGGTPTISSSGGNTNVSLGLATQGGGSIVLAPGGTGQLAINSADIQAGPSYAPANAKSLTTKEYVDAAVGGPLSSGTYSPTLSFSGCGCTASLSAPLAYSRVGSVVSVSGTFDVTSSGTGTRGFIAALPVATNLANVFQVTGVATVTDWNTGAITGPGIVYGNTNPPSNNQAVVYWNSISANRQLIRVSFSYTVQ